MTFSVLEVVSSIQKKKISSGFKKPIVKIETLSVSITIRFQNRSGFFSFLFPLNVIIYIYHEILVYMFNLRFKDKINLLDKQNRKRIFTYRIKMRNTRNRNSLYYYIFLDG